MMAEPENKSITPLGGEPNSRKSPSLTAILQAGRTRRIKEIPYLGGTVYAHGFQAQESDVYEKECEAAAGSIAHDEYSDARLIQHCIRNEDGARIFGPEHLTEIAAFNQADKRVLLTACYEVNGLGELGREYVRKNCTTTRSTGSGSGSPPTTGSE
jgi:hypothetical protein